MTRDAILAEIAAERERQVLLGFDAAHDDGHSLAQWIVNLSLHLGLAGWDGAPDDVCLPHDAVRPYDPARYRKQLVRVAAVAVAALEAFDRAAALSNGHAPAEHPLAAPGPDGDPRATAGPGELTAATPAVPPAWSRSTPEQWAQGVADERRAVVLLFDRRIDTLKHVEEVAPYCVAEADADAWERQAGNQRGRFEPRKGG